MVSCVAFLTTVSPAAVLEGFTLTNGSGAMDSLSVSATMQTVGGALYIKNSTSGVLSPTIRNCEISGNSSFEAGAVLIRYAEATFEDCVFSNNMATGPTVPIPGTGDAATTSGVLVQGQAWNDITFRRCVFRQHGGPGLIKVPSGWGPALFLEDCLIEQNTSESCIQGAVREFRLERCCVRQNVGEHMVSVGAVLGAPPPPALVVADCSFVENQCTSTVVSLSASSSASLVTRSTIASNEVGVSSLGASAAALVYSGTLQIESSIAQANYVNVAGVSVFATWGAPGASIAARDSNLQSRAGLGATVVDLDPLFVDSAHGDFRLLPGSTMIDAGTSNPAWPLVADVRGLPRVRGLAPDMGAYEAQALAHHPAAAGRVGENAGGPFDILEVNGSAGGALRRVSVPIGSSGIVDVLQPPHLQNPVHFTVFGFFGAANFDTVVNVPFGIGDMMFTLCPMAPAFQPQLFSFATSTTIPLGCGPLFWATPTPWTSPPGPAIFFPLTITLQGVIEEAPGVLVPTNAIVYELK